LSGRLSQEYEAQASLSRAEELREEQYLSAMAALDEYFHKSDEENRAAGEEGVTGEDHHTHHHAHEDRPHHQHHKHTHATDVCNFELMDKLPGQWSKWTGNTHISGGLQKLVPTFSHGDLPGESIKIPFKSTLWQPRTKVKTGVVEESLRVSTAETLESFEELHVTDLSAAELDTHSESNTQPYFTQLAYGKVNYQPKESSEYWNSLTLTECLMASPFFQHMSSEKFSALEHFAVLRSYKDKEVIVEQEQKFYNVFFIRYALATHVTTTFDTQNYHGVYETFCSAGTEP